MANDLEKIMVTRGNVEDQGQTNDFHVLKIGFIQLRIRVVLL